MIRDNKLLIIIQDFNNNEWRIEQNILKYPSYKLMNKAIDSFIKYINTSNDRFVPVHCFLNLIEDEELYLYIPTIKSIHIVNYNQEVDNKEYKPKKPIKKKDEKSI